jgi:type I restriction enzyme M protein
MSRALTVLNKWNTGEKVENKLAVYVEKSKIAENGEYNLSVERYRIATDYTNAKWSMVKLGDVCDVYQPKTITSNQIKESGKYKVFGANGVIGYFDQYNHEEAEVAVTCRGATCGTVNFTEPRSWITGNAMVIKPKENNLNKRYLFFLLRSTDLTSVITGAAQPQITGSALKPFLIPLPPLEIQEQLVAELDGYAGIVAGAKQITQHWRPKIDIDPEWEKVKIGDICIIGDGNHSSKYPRSDEMVDVGVPFIRGVNMIDGKIVDENLIFISPEKHQQLKKGHLKTGDILFSNRGEIGKVAYVDERFNGANLNSQLAWLRSKEKIQPKYLISILMSDYTQDQLLLLKQGATLQQFTIKQLSAFEIPLPSLDIQKQIVEKIEAERALVESAKKLIAIYDQKTKDAISKLWNE